MLFLGDWGRNFSVFGCRTYNGLQRVRLMELAAQHLISSVTSTIILWFTIKWKPTLDFSWKRMKVMYLYGWKLLAASMLSYAYADLRIIIIGYFYSAADLAYYNKGQSFPRLFAINIAATINSVLFPAISKNQNSLPDVKRLLRQSMKTTSYIIWPIMAGLAVCAQPLVLLLLTDKWSEAIIFIQLACFVYAMNPVAAANSMAVKAIGRSDITLYIQIIKNIIGVSVLFAVMRHGVFVIALSQVMLTVISIFLDMMPNAKLIGYRISEQLIDILPAIAMSAVMAGAIYPINFLGLPHIATISLQATGGVALYTALSLLFKVESFYFILNMLKQLITKKKVKEK
jgi:O-antigen/teichoic acid export membrane protein